MYIYTHIHIYIYIYSTIKEINRHTIKVSYSCMSNVQQLIKKHSNFIQNTKNKTTPSCNCGDKNGCPLNGNCRTENVILSAPH